MDGVQECCDKRNKVRASQTMVKWNNLFVSLLLVACIAGGAWLLYAGSPIIRSLDSLTNQMVEEVGSGLWWALSCGTVFLHTCERIWCLYLSREIYLCMFESPLSEIRCHCRGLRCLSEVHCCSVLFQAALNSLATGCECTTVT